MGAVAAMTVLLETRKLTRSFGGIRAVDGVDFTLEAGEIRALIGPNGAGKTTFVSLICGRVPVESGSIIFEGRDITHLPAHKRVRLGIAYTFQITSIFPNLTVRENVELAGMREGHEAQIALDVLTRVGLAHIAEQKAGDLAYGHQRLVEIAMGLALNPRLLILDEPTQGLSTAEVEAFISLIRQVAKSTTILLIEHNMQVVMELAHRITVMERGRILAEGTPEEIRSNQAVQQAYLGA
ncbi:ABC transporter ATP-binding protein [Chelativorans composti]|jgi:ABC-type branched-chain amino acid transport systems, ATPase component